LGLGSRMCAGARLGLGLAIGAGDYGSWPMAAEWPSAGGGGSRPQALRVHCVVPSGRGRGRSVGCAVGALPPPWWGLSALRGVGRSVRARRGVIEGRRRGASRVCRGVAPPYGPNPRTAWDWR